MTSKVTQILDKPGHDEVVAQAKHVPTCIYVSNDSLPACKKFQAQYEELARKWSELGVKFCQLEFTSKTSMMFKFAPNQLPISVFMVNDNWCKTVMTADLAGLESALELLLHEAKKGADHKNG